MYKTSFANLITMIKCVWDSQNNDNLKFVVIDYLTLDYTKPLETAIAVTTRNVPLNEQASIENGQSSIEDTIQSNTVTTGMYS